MDLPSRSSSSSDGSSATSAAAMCRMAARGRDLNEAEMAYALSQLRHAYMLLVNGHVTSFDAFANGLLAPQIRRLENVARRLAAVND